MLGALQLLFLLSFTGGGMAETDDKNVMEKKNAFANSLYKAIAEHHRQRGQPVNLICSPASLEIVLAAAALGAGGVTQQQISSAIGFPIELESMKRRYSPILVDLKNDSCILRVATHMFVQENYILRENFLNSTRDVFDCGAVEVNFVEEPALAVKTVNDWVEQKTEGLIKDLISIDSITTDTRLALVNAVYFKGKWAHPFDKAMTRKDKFNVGGGVQVDVDMMFIEKHFRHGYVQDIKAQVLELPYEGNKLSMVILLPFEDSSIQELESHVSAPDFDLTSLLENKTRSNSVMVHLPKFKLELTSDLEGVLVKLGMTEMFSDLADFSGMTSSPEGLKVSKVVQKAYIEVSEEGTEAAAATGMLFISKGVRRVESFNANRPFLVALRGRESGVVLFSGLLENPILRQKAP